MKEEKEHAVSEQPMINENLNEWLQDALSRFPEYPPVEEVAETGEAQSQVEEKPLPTTVVPLPSPEQAAAMQANR